MKKTITRTLLAWMAGALGLAPGAWAQCPTATCTPGTATNSSAQFIEGGIYSVQLGQRAYAGTGYAAGYLDSSCSRGVTITVGSTFAISVQTGAQVEENVRVYVDANNDGVFDSTGSELVFSSNSRMVHTGVITLPTNALTNRFLRLRIATDAIVSGLPSPCRTPEYGQTRDFYVIALPNTTPPIADFTTADSITCSGTVHFIDESLGAPTHWHWDFGDGGSDTVQNPTHFYPQSGTYSVTLIAINGNGSDTITRPNLVRFNDTVPVSACVITTTAYCCGYGVTRVRLTPVSASNPAAVLDHSSANGSAGYEDFTCRIRTRLTEGRPYHLELTTNPSQAQATKVWIDANGNGTFEDSELVLNNASAINPQDTFTAPLPTGAAIGHAVRMRIITDGSGSTISGCRNPQLGQGEDYTILLVENTLPPVAVFHRSGGTNCDSTYTFTSNSENAISSYIWRFGDGTTDTTTTGNVTHSYADPGTYDVQLVVVGTYGRDSATIANAVTYVLAPAQATCGGPATTNTCCNIGISNVTFGTINVSSGLATEGYRDFTCEGSTTILASSPTAFTITTGAQQLEKVRVWVDLNNNQEFGTDELLLSLADGRGTRTASITLPPTAVLGMPLRVRVLSFSSQVPTANPSPCAAITFGQFEDYSVVVLANQNPPRANFGADSRTTCDGRIVFRDSAYNALSYLYDFGDGTTDTTAAPVHTYDTTGTYTVTLIVRNAFGTDTLVRTDYITIYPNLNLAAAPCQPAATQTFNNFGITRVQFSTIDNTTAGAVDGYKDYTCTNIARLKLDTTASLTVTTGSQNTEAVSAWIDYNADGQFDDTERLGSGTANATTPWTVFVSFPGTAVINRGLRMRVMSDLAQGGPGGGTPLQPCQNIRAGQAEDYAIVLLSTITQAPAANFYALNRNVCSGLIQFRDSSLRSPAHYLWSFGDGGTDTAANPSHQYTAAGTYTVTLVATNAIGSDTAVRTAYITYQPLAGLAAATCFPSYTTTPARVGFQSLTVNGTTVVATTTTPVSGTYTDRTCNVPVIQLGAGDSLSITSMSPQFDDSLAVYLDLNNDGAFTDNERILRHLTRTAQSMQGNTFQGAVLLPVSTPLDTVLRLRLVMSSNPMGRVATPLVCGANTAGAAVDIALRAVPAAPHAHFNTALASGCGLSLSFASTSTGAPNHYLWNFGDGTTDTTAAPSHTFPAAGVYIVHLTVANDQGTDSTMRTVTVVSQAVPALCTPQATAANGNLTDQGIISVTLQNQATGATVTHASANASIDPYLDRVCDDILSASVGNVVTVRVRPTQATQQFNRRYELYLDLNNDGDLPASERQGLPLNVQGNAEATLRLTVPVTAVSGLLRLRVIEYYNTGLTNTCTVINDGQAEDYGLFVDNAVASKPLVSTALTFGLAPNPAAQQVRLTADLPGASVARLTLIDATGRIVLTRTLNGTSVSESLDVTSLPSGVYQAVLTQGSQRALQRLVVEK